MQTEPYHSCQLLLQAKEISQVLLGHFRGLGTNFDSHCFRKPLLGILDSLWGGRPYQIQLAAADALLADRSGMAFFRFVRGFVR